MKKYVAILAVLAVLVFALPADAKIVSINIASNSDRSKDVGPGDLAGAVPAPNWNNAPLSHGGTVAAGGLVDDSAVPTTAMVIEQRSGDTRNAAVAGAPDVNTNMYEALAPHVSVDNSRNFAFGPNVSTRLTNLNAEFPGGYDLHLYLSNWSFSGNGAGEIVVYNDPTKYGRGYDGHNPPWTDGIANLPYNLMPQPTYDSSQGIVLGDNYVKLEGLSDDTIVLQPYPYVHLTGFNAIAITGLQLVAPEEDEEPVIPEPAGLGVVGLALLSLRKRRS